MKRTLAALLQDASNGLLELTMITDRGVKVWPNGLPETFGTDREKATEQKSNPEEVSSVKERYPCRRISG